MLSTWKGIQVCYSPGGSVIPMDRSLGLPLGHTLYTLFTLTLLCNPSPTVSSFCKAETWSCETTPLSPTPRPLATTILIPVSRNMTTQGVSYKGNHAIFIFFVTGLFHLSDCPQGSSMCSTCQNFLSLKAK